MKTVSNYPIFHNNQRTEYLLNYDSAFDQDVVLDGVGMTSANNVANLYVNPLAGWLGAVDRMELYKDNTELLCECQNVYKYASFVNLQHDNGNNGSRNGILDGSQLGYTYLQSAGLTLPVLSTYNPANAQVLSLQKKVTTDATTTSVYRVHLSALLKFFESRQFTPDGKEVRAHFRNDLIKNVRLVIYYRSDLSKVVSQVPNAGGAPGAITMLAGSLTLDEVDKNALPPKVDLIYESIIHDAVSMSNVVGGNTQKLPLIFNGLNGLLVKRFLLMNDCASEVMLVNSYSPPQLKESFSIVNNGSLVLESSGINPGDINTQHFYTADAYGSLNYPPFANMAQPAWIANVNNYFGAGCMTNIMQRRAGYLGVKLNQVCSKLTVNYQRVGTTVANNNQQLDALTMHCFAEVPKVLSAGKITSI